MFERRILLRLYAFHLRVNVTEDQGELALTVYRDQGLVGRVTVIAFAVGQGATIGTDFTIENLMVCQQKRISIVV